MVSVFQLGIFVNFWAPHTMLVHRHTTLCYEMKLASSSSTKSSRNVYCMHFWSVCSTADHPIKRVASIMQYTKLSPDDYGLLKQVAEEGKQHREERASKGYFLSSFSKF